MESSCERGYLMWAELLWERVENKKRFPYTLPLIRTLDRVDFHPRVTFFIGENGSGKSTLLEAIAIAWGFNPEGGSKNFHFSTHASHSALHRALRLARAPKRVKDGFFLRAESYFNVATTIDRIDQEPGCSPPVKDAYGGVSLHEQSHGESFFALFLHRFRGNGFYVLDEPEAALSPQRQLAFLARLHELVGRSSQFVVATHSPIIMSYPDAWIYQIGEQGLERVAYEDTEHFRITRDFLNRPAAMLDRLLEDASRGGGS